MILTRLLGFLALFLMLQSFAARATSPCKGDGCIDEASANFVVPYDVLEKKCSLINPALRTQYLAVVTYFLRNEDPELVKKLRASTIYAQVRTEFEAQISRQSAEEFAKSCESFVEEPKGPIEQSIRTR